MINLPMRKIQKIATATTAALGYFAASTKALAIQITPPTGAGIKPTTAPSTIISNVINIMFAAAALLVFFFLILGAFNWITSGGDKEKVSKARGIIVNALIGLAILALALVIVTVIGKILGINVTGPFTINDLSGTPTDI